MVVDRSCASQVLACLAGIILLALELGSAYGQSSKAIEEDHHSIDMFRSIKATIDRNSKGDLGNAYRKVQLRLLSCAVAYQILMNKPGASTVEMEGFGSASKVYFRVAAAIRAISLNRVQSEDEFKADVDLAGREFLKIQGSSPRAIFQLLRTCKDFSSPDTVHAAVLDVIM